MSQKDNIRWVEASGLISELYNKFTGQLGKRASSTYALFPRTGHIQTNIGISTTNADLRHALNGAFDISHGPCSVDFYHIDNAKEIVFRSSPSADLPANIGFYSRNHKEVLIVESNPLNYGFVNAMILGAFSSHMMNAGSHFYAHAACLSLDGSGALIVGDHKSGKSTLVSKIISMTEGGNLSVGIVSDDWVLIKEQDSFHEAQRVSDEYRIDLATCANPIIGLSQHFKEMVQRHTTSLSDKCSIPMRDLCVSMQMQDLTQAHFDTIILLDPTQSGPLGGISSDKFLTVMEASTTNVKPLTDQQKEASRTFWKSLLSSKKTLAVNSRYAECALEKTARDVINFMQPK